MELREITVDPFEKYDKFVIQLDKRKNQLKKMFLNNICILFECENEFIVFSPSTRENIKYQLTYLDKNMNPWGDTKSNNINDLIEYIVLKNIKIVKTIENKKILGVLK